MYTIDWDEQSRLHSPYYKDGGISYPLPNGKTLHLLPGAAFGDCSHPTTRLSLALLSCCDIKRVVDIGTGNGVLALAAALLGAEEVLGVDIDAEALKVAQQNAQLNTFVGRICFCDDIPQRELPQGKFGVLSNMTLGEQRIVVEHYRDLFKKSIWAIFSGLLWYQRDELMALLPGRWTLEEELQEGEWIAIKCHNLDCGRGGQIAGKLMK